MTLYVVASPIGNLADLSRRAEQILATCDLVVAEDTRHTGRLLAHLDLDKPLLSFYEEVEQRRIPKVLEALDHGRTVALVSDAGTPGVSDPGFRLVRAAIQAGVRIVPIPGPSAVLAALVASGLPTDRFRFEGFLPRGRTQRSNVFRGLAHESATTVFFEAPTRLIESLHLLGEALPQRPCAVARELTKVHEEILRGTAPELNAQLSARDRVRGEVTLVVAGAPRPPSADQIEIRRVADVLAEEGLAPKVVRSITARLLGVPKKAVFEAMRERP